MKLICISTLILSLGLVSCNKGPDSTALTPVNILAAPQNASLGYHIDLKESGAFTGLTALNQATLTAQPNQCLIASSGNDPSVGLPALTMTPPIQFAVRAELTTPADTLVEIYYTTSALPTFSPDHVVSVPAKAGKSILLFEINDPTFAGGVRFDPGQAPGQYILHNLEFFASEPISLAKAPPPAPITKQ